MATSYSESELAADQKINQSASSTEKHNDSPLRDKSEKALCLDSKSLAMRLPRVTAPKTESGASSEQADLDSRPTKIEVRDLVVDYGEKRALHSVSLNIPDRSVTALIGPSGCGKSTFLRCLNRMNDMVESARVSGTVLMDGDDVYGDDTDLVELRKRVGMVFQKSNPFPKSVFDNVAYGPRVAGIRRKEKLHEIVKRALERAALWREVEDRLNDSALGLSGGQQQRLCIARALATSPEVILMDEPASALDPASTSRVEDLIFELKQQYTIVIVTHNMQQAARISDQTAFFFDGHLIESGATTDIFTCPRVKKTEDYITGRFG